MKNMDLRLCVKNLLSHFSLRRDSRTLCDLLRQPAKGHLFAALFLVSACFIVYWSALGHDFLIYDDKKYVIDNQMIRGLSLEHVKMSFSSIIMGNYAPLHFISYMVDYSVWGMNARGFILTNLILHAANGFLFYLLLIAMRWHIPSACTAAFLFVCHPVQVESVAWIAERKNLLAMFFFLSAAIFYILFRNRGGGRARLFYILSIISFILSLLSKSVAVIFPLVITLYDICLVKRDNRHYLLLNKVPFVILALAAALVTFISQSPELGGGRRGYHGGPLATFFTMLPVLGRYLRMVICPTELSVSYNPQIKYAPDVAVAGAAVLVVLLVGAAFWLYRQRRELLFWFLLFFIGLLPVSQIVPLYTLMNDRYLYFPMLGAAAFFTAIASMMINHVSGWGKGCLALFYCLLLLTFPIMAVARVTVWKDDLTLWSDAVKKEPDNPLGWKFMAEAYTKRGDFAAAAFAYRKYVSLRPGA